MENEEQITETTAETPAENIETTEPVSDAPAPETETPVAADTEESAETPATEPDDTPAAAETSDARKADKPRKPRGKGMSKLFKLVYYPVIAVLALVMLVFSIVDGAYGYKPSKANADYFEAVDKHIETLAAATRSSLSANGVDTANSYIVKALADGGFNRVDEVKEGEESDDDDIKTVTGFASVGNANAPTVTLMTAHITGELCESMNAPVRVGDITNVVAAIPSYKTRAGEDSDAVIITVHYDSRIDGTDATQGAFVANVMQTLIDYVADGVDFENDLVVVFTEDLDHAYGSYVFFDAFEGFKNVVSRAKVGLTLDSFGNGGTLALTDVSAAGYDYVSDYIRAAGTVFNASAVPSAIPDEIASAHAVKAFGEIPALQVAVLGGIDYAQSQLDNIDNLDAGIIDQQAAFVKSYIEKFAYSQKQFGAATTNMSFVSYFDWGTIGYNSTAAYVIGAIIVALLVAAIVVIAVKKQFSLKKLFIAFGVELAVLASAVVCMFAAYFFVTLLLSGFGVLPIHAITQLRYFNAGILIAAMIIGAASAFGFSSLYKKLLHVTASDLTRGTALLFGLVGAIMSFAAPSLSYLASWLGLLMLVVLLVTACLNGKLKDKFGFGFDRLFPYVIPVILCMPIVMSSVTMLTALLPLYLLPVLMLLFVGMLGTVAPYFDRTVKVFDGVAKKLPMRTQRVERVVVEKIEDRAKKGKFTEKKVKRVENVKVPVNYKNYFGITVIAVIGVVVALFSGGFGATFAKNITAPNAYANAIYNDALVYEWDKTSGTATQRVVIDDLIAYKYFRYALDDLTWDSARGCYTKRPDLSTNVSEIIGQEPSVRKEGNLYTVTTFDGPRSFVTLKLSGTSTVTEITVKDALGNEYVYNFLNQSEIELRLPYGFGGDRTFTMEIEASTLPTSVYYEEYRPVSVNENEKALSNLYEWNQLLGSSYLQGSDVLDMLHGGIVLKMNVSL